MEALLNARVAHECLLRKCFIDYDHEMALVAERADHATESREILGVGRLTQWGRQAEGEVAILIADGGSTSWTRCGIAWALDRICARREVRVDRRPHFTGQRWNARVGEPVRIHCGKERRSSRNPCNPQVVTLTQTPMQPFLSILQRIQVIARVLDAFLHNCQSIEVLEHRVGRWLPWRSLHEYATLPGNLLIFPACSDSNADFAVS